jgi:predicted  nucleic acid-binding Zn-ribbon protein
VSRVRTLFVLILPSAIAGGLLFASAFSRADVGSRGALGAWPAASDAAPGTGRVLVAQAEPPPPRRYAPPAPPVPPPPPPPPPPPGSSYGRGHGHGRGFSLSIHDGKVEIDGIAELVQESLEKALETLDHLPDVPPDTRMRLRGRIQGVRNQINARLSRLKSMDLDKVGPEIERMGDEIERQMEGLDQELAQLGDKIGKSFAQKFGKGFAKGFGPGVPSVGPGVPSVGPGVPSVNPGSGHDSEDADDDDDDDDDQAAATLPPSPGPDVADQDPGPAIAALRGLALDAGQRAELARLHADSDRQITAAKLELKQMSNRLHAALRDSEASEADIARQIEAISAKEATIRKARILTWLKVRHLLHADQRKQVEDAVQNSR